MIPTPALGPVGHVVNLIVSRARAGVAGGERVARHLAAFDAEAVTPARTRSSTDRPDTTPYGRVGELRQMYRC